MGVTITNGITEVSMGYISFFHLRCEIAEIINKKFGKEYEDIMRDIYLNKISENRMVEIINECAAKYDLDEDIGEFLFEKSDSDDFISNKCARKLKPYIEKLKRDYGYISKNGKTAAKKDVVRLFSECYESKSRRRIVWY